MSSPTTRTALSRSTSFKRADVAREFYIPVELYLSPKAASGLPKPHSSRRKPEKRESIKQHSSTDENQKKLKEKTSWLNLGRGSPTAGQWRSATCKLSEEEEGCLLNIYIDQTILHQSVYIYQLNHTDIRPVDRSLFERNDCIVLHCVPGQRWSANSANEPIFLSFSNSDSYHTWLTLLRSYAMPEIYGQRISPNEGGLYRMWRQIEVNCMQGRNLGVPRTEGVPSGTSESLPEGETPDHDIFCELYLNETISGRTTAKKGIGSPEWHETFLIPDLPPFENLEIVVLKEKRMGKVLTLGTVLITLANFRRGEYVEGWFPVLDNTTYNVGTQVGEIKLKLKVDEEIILPHHEYEGMLQTLNSLNYLEWMNELGNRLQLKDVSSQFISIAVARNTLVESICELVNREVDGTPSTQNTLFRGNNVLSKTIELFMGWYGKAFLEASIGSVIRRIYAEKVAIEVDPVRSSGRNPRDIEKNVDLLVYWCKELWKSIYAVRGDCPHEMRKLFEHIRKLVEKRCRDHPSDLDQPSDLPWQSVSAFCFLRFIVPAILHPHLFGLVAGLPDLPVQRSLTLIAKAIQSLANLNSAVQKEEFMRGVKEFLSSSRPAMIDYIFVVSSPGPEPPSTMSVADRHIRLQVIDSLRQRGTSMPPLHREAIPLLPYMLDVPRHLALISSAVIRRSRGYQGKPRKAGAEDPRVAEFCGRCYELEDRALRRVTRLAGRSSQEPPRKRPTTSSARGNTPASPQSPRTLPSPTWNPTGPVGSRRPSTAPAPSPSDVSFQRQMPMLPPPPDPARVTSSSQHDLFGGSTRARPRLRTRFPSADSTSLRRVQTVETSSPTRLVSPDKRKGFFRSFLSKK